MKLDWQDDVQATQYLQRNLAMGDTHAWLNVYTAAPLAGDN